MSSCFIAVLVVGRAGQNSEFLKFSAQNESQRATWPSLNLSRMPMG